MRKRQNTWFFLFGLLLILGTFSTGPIICAEEKRAEDEGKVESREVTGTVSAVNKQGVAIEYARTATASSEMFLPWSDSVKLERLFSLGQLKAGDVVKVRYEQTYKEDKDGQRIVLKTVAGEVSMLKQTPGEDALVSKGQVSE